MQSAFDIKNDLLILLKEYDHKKKQKSYAKTLYLKYCLVRLKIDHHFHPSVLKLNGFSLPTKKKKSNLLPYLHHTCQMDRLKYFLKKANRSTENVQKIDLKNTEFEFNFVRKLRISPKII